MLLPSLFKGALSRCRPCGRADWRGGGWDRQPTFFRETGHSGRIIEGGKKIQKTPSCLEEKGLRREDGLLIMALYAKRKAYETLDGTKNSRKPHVKTPLETRSEILSLKVIHESYQSYSNRPGPYLHPTIMDGPLLPSSYTPILSSPSIVSQQSKLHAVVDQVSRAWFWNPTRG